MLHEKFVKCSWLNEAREPPDLAITFVPSCISAILNIVLESLANLGLEPADAACELIVFL
jgi:hypothetical protein